MNNCIIKRKDLPVYIRYLPTFIIKLIILSLYILAPFFAMFSDMSVQSICVEITDSLRNKYERLRDYLFAKGEKK